MLATNMRVHHIVITGGDACDARAASLPSRNGAPAREEDGDGAGSGGGPGR